jgi:hypothetical protein
VPHRIGEDLEDIVRGSADPPGYGDGLILIVGHESRPFSGRPPPHVRGDAW